MEGKTQAEAHAKSNSLYWKDSINQITALGSWENVFFLFFIIIEFKVSQDHNSHVLYLEYSFPSEFLSTSPQIAMQIYSLSSLIEKYRLLRDNSKIKQKIILLYLANTSQSKEKSTKRRHKYQRPTRLFTH